MTDAGSALMFGAKNFFNGDYDFYFRNNEENAVKRVETYLEKIKECKWKT